MIRWSSGCGGVLVSSALMTTGAESLWRIGNPSQFTRPRCTFSLTLCGYLFATLLIWVIARLLSVVDCHPHVYIRLRGCLESTLMMIINLTIHYRAKTFDARL